MTTLTRTGLTTAEKIECAASVLALQAQGDKTRLSEDYGVSRPTLYEVERSTHEVLKQHFESGGKVTVVVDQAQLERSIVALRVIAPNSYRAIDALLPILYPDVQVSYGHIHAVATEAGQNSRAHLDQVDLSASEAAALDELFSQGDPRLSKHSIKIINTHNIQCLEKYFSIKRPHTVLIQLSNFSLLLNNQSLMIVYKRLDLP